MEDMAPGSKHALELVKENVPTDYASHLRPKKKARHLCSLGTGEAIHVLSYNALADRVDEFEFVIQGLARSLYSMTSAVSDVRVCHPKVGEVVFIVTFVSKAALDKFKLGPQVEFEKTLEGLACNGANFEASGTMMPAAHTLTSLLEYLKKNVKGDDHNAHDVREVSKEIERWFPRPGEYDKYITLDPNKPKQYTRNLIHGDENMDVILMCWPPGCKSTIHDHDTSSCWVTVVEGSVHEVQYQLPQLDRKFLEAEQKDPATAIGHCGKLKLVNVAELDTGGVTGTYANNDIGIHRVENRTSTLACTLHVYAPPLKKMKIFSEEGTVHVHVASSSKGCEEGGCDDEMCRKPWEKGIFDVEAWNKQV